MRSGTSVNPFAFVLPRSWSIWVRWSSSFRSRFGSWFSRLALSHGAMWAPTSQASPRSIRAKASARLILPALIDLISVPDSATPASIVSSIENSWRARRLTAIVFSGM